ncbi:dTDP-4-dehydrorhamnose reductase [Ligilactobacillus sp. LYQ135]
MTVLITGATGQLGTELQKLFKVRDEKVDALDASQLDITDKKAVNQYFAKNHPERVYHCAAYTAVDKAEKEAKELDELVNVEGTRNIAEACKKYGTVMYYVSTDYVFSGDRVAGEYDSTDPTGPVNEYGRTKLLGEKIVQSLLDKYYIIRTSWVYAKAGNNFIYTMLKLAKTHDTITVVSDQVGRPTWAKTLAEFLLYLTDNHCPYGIYQCSDDEEASWYEFASEILKDEDVKVLPIETKDYPTVAQRPLRTVMKLSKETGFEFPTWKESLHKFMKEIGYKA